MAISVKAVLHASRVDKKGLCPVLIQVIQNRQKIYHQTGIRLPQDMFLDGTVSAKYPNARLLNIKINQIITGLETELLKREINGEVVTLKKVKEMMMPDDGSKNDFLKHALKVIAGLKVSSAKRFMVEYNELGKYAGNRLSFADITPVFLNRYYKHLIGIKAHNTALNAFKFIKLVFNDARRLGITTLYPFTEFKVGKYKQTMKDYLTVEECDKLFAVLDKNVEQEFKTITAFFLLECFSGIRHSDWKLYQVEKMIDKDVLVLTTTKTGVLIKLPVDLMPSLGRVLKYIRDNELTYNRTLQHANRILRLVAGIAEIPKHITTHTGRRTCATLLLEKGLSREAVAAVLGISLKVIDTYAKFTTNKIRRELERVGGI